jgi:ribosomal protein S27E
MTASPDYHGILGQFRFALFSISNSFFDSPALQKNPDFYARYMQVWCWKCGKATTHEITFRWGGRCFLCKDCGNIVVEKL